MIYEVSTLSLDNSIFVAGLGPQITPAQVTSIAMSMLDSEIVDVEFLCIHEGASFFGVEYDHEDEGRGVAEFHFEPLQVEDISSFPGQQPVPHVPTPQDRLDYLRTELRKERISTDELIELQSLVEYIDPSDVELLEAAGVPEVGEDEVGAKWVSEDKCHLHCIEFPNGHHVGMDYTYLDQVGGIRVTIEELDEEGNVVNVMKHTEPYAG